MVLLPQFWLAVALGIAGIVVLRSSWSQPSRSALFNALGWGSIMFSGALASWAHGAWGVAVSSLFVMAAALLLLLPSIASNPKWKRKPIDTGVHRGKGEKPALAPGRKTATFMIAGPAALLAALMLALVLRAVLSALGGAEADVNVLVLTGVPLFWAILSTALLMTDRRRVQAALLAAIAIPALPISVLVG